MISQRLQDAFYAAHGFRVSDIENMLNQSKISSKQIDCSLNIIGRGNPSLGTPTKPIEQIDKENDELIRQLDGKIY